MKALSLSLALAAGLLFQAPAQADILLIERVQIEPTQAMPSRGKTMGQIEAQFGAPQAKHAPISGPNARRHNPPITRWVYPNFQVYFEYNHVVDAVANRATPSEIGPKPVQ